MTTAQSLPPFSNRLPANGLVHIDLGERAYDIHIAGQAFTTPKFWQDNCSVVFAKAYKRN